MGQGGLGTGPAAARRSEAARRTSARMGGAGARVTAAAAAAAASERDSEWVELALPVGTHHPCPNPHPFCLGRVRVTHLNLDTG